VLLALNIAFFGNLIWLHALILILGAYLFLNEEETEIETGIKTVLEVLQEIPDEERLKFNLPDVYSDVFNSAEIYPSRDGAFAVFKFFDAKGTERNLVLDLRAKRARTSPIVACINGYQKPEVLLFRYCPQKRLMTYEKALATLEQHYGIKAETINRLLLARKRSTEQKGEGEMAVAGEEI